MGNDDPLLLLLKTINAKSPSLKRMAALVGRSPTSDEAWLDSAQLWLHRGLAALFSLLQLPIAIALRANYN